MFNALQMDIRIKRISERTPDGGYARIYPDGFIEAVEIIAELEAELERMRIVFDVINRTSKIVLEELSKRPI